MLGQEINHIPSKHPNQVYSSLRLVEAVNWQHGREFFKLLLLQPKWFFSSTFITIGLKKSFISQPEEDVYRVSDMLINMLSWNVSITHDTKLQKRFRFSTLVQKLQNYKY